MVGTLKTVVPFFSGDSGSRYHSVKSTRGDLAFYGWGESKLSADTSNHATNKIPMITNKSDGYTTWRIKGGMSSERKLWELKNRGGVEEGVEETRINLAGG